MAAFILLLRLQSAVDGDKSWSPLSFDVQKFVFDPIDSNIIYALTAFGAPSRIMGTIDRGNSWTPIRINKSGISLLAVAPSNPAILYAVGVTAIYNLCCTEVPTMAKIGSS